MFIKNQIYINDIHSVCSLKLPWEKLENKTIMISGASGMIGCSLIDALICRNERFSSNINLIAVSRNSNKLKNRFEDYLARDDFKCISHDINEPIPEIGDVDFIIHAASNTHPKQYAEDPIGTITSNISGTASLLDYGVSKKIDRFVFLSSVEIYGENNTNNHKLQEDDLGYIDCNSLRAGYPESKRAGEALCNAYNAEYGMSFVIPRLSRVYGPTVLVDDTKASSQFISKALNNEDIVLKSKGEQLYSYTYITDCISAILYIMLLGENGEAYNVADDDSDVTLKWMAATLADIVNRGVIFDLPDETEAKGYSKATKALLDSSKLKRLGWKAQDTMKTGLKKTIQILK